MKCKVNINIMGYREKYLYIKIYIGVDLIMINVFYIW